MSCTPGIASGEIRSVNPEARRVNREPEVSALEFVRSLKSELGRRDRDVGRERRSPKREASTMQSEARTVRPLGAAQDAKHEKKLIVEGSL